MNAEAEVRDPLSVVSSPARKPKPLSAKRLEQLRVKLLMQIWAPINKAEKHDPELMDALSAVGNALDALNSLVSTRRGREARGADKGEVCWEVFRPDGMDSVVAREVRTPHSMTIHFRNGREVVVARNLEGSGLDPWGWDFDRAMGRAA